MNQDILEQARQAPGVNPFFTEETTRRDPADYVLNAAAQYHAHQNDQKAKMGAAKMGTAPADFEAERQAADTEAAQAKLNNELVLSTLDMPDDEWQKLMGQISAEVGARPERPPTVQPGMPNPWISIASAAAGLAQPERAAKYAAIPWMQKVEEAARQTAEQNQRFEDELNAREERIKFLMSRADDQTRRDLADLEIAKTNEANKISAYNAEENRRLREETAASNEAYRRDQLAQREEQNARSGFDSAKTVGSMNTWGRKLVGMELMSEDDLKIAVKEKQGAWQKEFQSAVKQMTPEGYAYGDNLTELEAMKAEYVARGIPESMLPIPTEKTHKAKLENARLQEYNTNLKYLDKEWSLKLAKMEAEKDAIQTRLEIAQRNGDTAVYNAELRAYEIQTKGFDDGTGKAIAKLERDLINLDGQLRGASPGKARDIQSKINGMSDELNFLRMKQSDAAAMPTIPDANDAMRRKMPPPKNKRPTPNMSEKKALSGDIGGGWSVRPK